MSKLYELSAEYAHLLQRAEDGEDVAGELDALSDDLETKAVSIAKVLASLDAQAEEIDREKERLAARAKSLAGQREHLKSYLLENMKRCGIERIKHALFTISLRQGPPKVEVTSEEKIPNAFMREKTTKEPDKAAILAAFKADGEMVPGTEIVRGVSLQIK